MKISIFVFVVAFVLLSCVNDKNHYSKTATGLEYIIVNHNKEAKKPNTNDVVTLCMDIVTEQNELIFTTKESERKYMRKITDPQHPGGSFEDALLMLHIGDSAIFRIDAYNYYKYTEKGERLPEKLKKGDKIIIRIRLDDIVETTEYDDVLLEKYHKDEKTEMELLSAYLQRTNTSTEPSASGLYYIETLKGNGIQAIAGRLVKVHYTGSLIDGSVFDTSLGGRPIEFILGNGEVIAGWDEGIANMKAGGKARLIIPSKLAYGATGTRGILPYSTLIFEVELISVQ